VEGFNLKKLSELEVRKSIRLKSQKCLQHWRTWNDSEDIKRACKNIKENIKISAKKILGLQEWKQHKPWFHDEYSQLLDQRKQAKMQ
jgi:hypothetical protein